jgi:ribosomal protein S1
MSHQSWNKAGTRQEKGKAIGICMEGVFWEVIDVAEGLYRVSHQSWNKAGKRQGNRNMYGRHFGGISSHRCSRRIVQGVPPKLEQGRKKARQ